MRNATAHGVEGEEVEAVGQRAGVEGGAVTREREQLPSAYGASVSGIDDDGLLYCAGLVRLVPYFFCIFAPPMSDFDSDLGIILA